MMMTSATLATMQPAMAAAEFAGADALSDTASRLGSGAGDFAGVGLGAPRMGGKVVGGGSVVDRKRGEEEDGGGGGKVEGGGEMTGEGAMHRDVLESYTFAE